jgi:hypothetical protein
MAHFNAPASKLPAFEPPDLVTNDVSTGTALLTMSGESPSFENADAALANPLAPPPSGDSVLEAAPPLEDGAALSSESIPGTAVAICEKSSALRRDFATPKSVPAAPAACSGVALISFESAPISSGLALAAAVASADAAPACAGLAAAWGTLALEKHIATRTTIPRQACRVMGTSVENTSRNPVTSGPPHRDFAGEFQ